MTGSSASAAAAEPSGNRRDLAEGWPVLAMAVVTSRGREAYGKQLVQGRAMALVSVHITKRPGCLAEKVRATFAEGQCCLQRGQSSKQKGCRGHRLANEMSVC